MCGRFTLTADSNAVQAAFSWAEPQLGDLPAVPRYNIAPTQSVTAVIFDGRHQLVQLKWGLVPAWSKVPQIVPPLFNARAETVSEKPSFRSAYRQRRCLILADGWFEWQVPAAGKAKQPHWVTLASRHIFAMAGLWEKWAAPGGAELRTCTVITCAATAELAPLHARMPVILEARNYGEWLRPDASDAAAVRALLRPWDAEPLRVQPVSTVVNNARVDSRECVQPLAASPELSAP